MSVVGKALSGLLEQEYAKQRNEAAEELHNAIVEIINEKQPSIETTLYVLETLKVNLLQKKAKFVEPGAVAGGWRDQREKANAGRVQADNT
jgi:hypothetical protein